MLALPSVVAFVNLLALALADCDTFTPVLFHDDQISYTTIGRSTPISNTLICNGSTVGTTEGLPASSQLTCNATQCPLAVADRYLVSFSRIFNISDTISESDADKIFELVRPNLPPPNSQNGTTNFNATWTYVAPQDEVCRREGTNGWWSFTPYYRCVDGILSGCGDGDPADGTAVQACGVETDIERGDLLVPYALGDLRVVEYGGDEDRPAPANATLQSEQQDQQSAANTLGGSGWLGIHAAVIMMVTTIFAMA